MSPSTNNFPEPTLKSSPASVPRVTPMLVPASEEMVSRDISPTLVILLSPKLTLPLNVPQLVAETISEVSKLLKAITFNSSFKAAPELRTTLVPLLAV